MPTDVLAHQHGHFAFEDIFADSLFLSAQLCWPL
ncbi:rCG32115 [Rattus norvegicus]|uniref:RCG32115 n=1 Tax=Rattus norvegicus TaxID=10116 RepID=A6JWZ0_RAT|nr:rCG32115 [Rattus norvegicus]